MPDEQPPQSEPDVIDTMPASDGGTIRILAPKSEETYSEPYSVPTPDSVAGAPISMPSPESVQREDYWEMPAPGGGVYRIYRR